MNKFLLLIILLLVPLVSFAQEKPLPANTAFVLTVKTQGDDTLLAHWQIHPGYYLYKQQFKFALVAPQNAKLAPVTLPRGIPKEDEIFGKYQVYFNQLTIPLKLTQFSGNKAAVMITYQGCSAAGFCYPPISKTIHINFGSGKIGMGATATLSAQDRAEQILINKNFIVTLLAFFGFGILLAFTPCVLPMVPILSGIIVGQGSKIRTKRAFLLSLTYILGMALMFAIAGVIAALIGSSLQAALQKPWVIIIFSIFFVLLALSLFGFYELKLPASIHERISGFNQRQQAGTYFGVAIMGALSTLVVSPCVTAPLIGALGYISNTGNTVLGGSALFAMGLGMGTPLLIFGTVGGKLLPKAGKWMQAVKDFFGILLLGLAIWMLERIIPGQVIMFLWAALLIVSAVYMGAFATANTGWLKLWKGLGLLLAFYGILLLIGGAIGNTDPFRPLALMQHFSSTPMRAPKANGLFKSVKTIADVQRAITNAKLAGKPVMLDFYADWCISCKIMERDTFANPEVQKALKNFVLLQADVTANDVQDKALMKHFNVIAPPAILFFNTDGKEINSARLVGELGPSAFLKHLKALP